MNNDKLRTFRQNMREFGKLIVSQYSDCIPKDGMFTLLVGMNDENKPYISLDLVGFKDGEVKNYYFRDWKHNDGDFIDQTEMHNRFLREHSNSDEDSKHIESEVKE